MTLRHLAGECQSEVELLTRAGFTSSREFVVLIQGIVAWLGLRLIVVAFGYIERGGRSCVKVSACAWSMHQYGMSLLTLILKLLRFGGSHTMGKWVSYR